MLVILSGYQFRLSLSLSLSNCVYYNETKLSRLIENRTISFRANPTLSLLLVKLNYSSCLHPSTVWYIYIHSTFQLQDAICCLRSHFPRLRYLVVTSNCCVQFSPLELHASKRLSNILTRQYSCQSL